MHYIHGDKLKLHSLKTFSTYISSIQPNLCYTEWSTYTMALQATRWIITSLHVQLPVVRYRSWILLHILWEIHAHAHQKHTAVCVFTRATSLFIIMLLPLANIHMRFCLNHIRTPIMIECVNIHTPTEPVYLHFYGFMHIHSTSIDKLRNSCGIVWHLWNSL